MVRRAQVIDVVVAPLDEGGADADHGPGDVVHGDDVQVDARLGGHEAVAFADQKAERRGGVDALVPAGLGVFDGRLNDGGASDGDVDLVAGLGEDPLAHGLGIGVDIGPTPEVGALGTQGR